MCLICVATAECVCRDSVNVSRDKCACVCACTIVFALFFCLNCEHIFSLVLARKEEGLRAAFLTDGCVAVCRWPLLQLLKDERVCVH